MTKIRLTIISQNQKTKEKAEQLSDIIRSILDIDVIPVIEKYNKLENSFKMTFEFADTSVKASDKRFGLIELTDRLCSPWIVYFKRDEDLIELIYNKTDSSLIRKNEFNVINWANLQMENE